MSDQIAAIRERWAKVTPGPWRLGSAAYRCNEDHQHGQGCCIYRQVGWHDDYHQISIDAPILIDWDAITIAGTFDYEEGGIIHERDAIAIAAAPADIATLLAEIDRLRAEVTR